MAERRNRVFVLALFLAAIAVFCAGSRVGAQDDRAKPRDRTQSQAERRHQAPPPTTRDESARRRPRPDEQYTRPRSRESREIDRYHWQQYDRRSRRARDRFPRFYFGITLFRGVQYYGEVFGPHYGLWYRDGRMFFWPYSYGPRRGCGWYYVPRERRLFVDRYSPFEEWEYWDYERLYICFD